jgi:hypothetical protein
MPTPTYTPLANITLGSAAATVTFGSIPATYRDLIVVVFSRDTNVSILTTQFLRLNSVSSGNLYSTQIMTGTGGGASAATTTSQNEFGIGQSNGSTSTADTFGQNIWQIMDYSSTDKHKTILLRTSAQDITRAGSGKFASTSAITTVNILAGTSFVAGSTFALYGIVA